MKNEERQFRKRVLWYLGIIALLAIVDRVAEFPIYIGMGLNPMSYSYLLQPSFRLLDQICLILAGIALIWEIVTFVTKQLKAIRNSQVELKPKNECREYPETGGITPDGDALTDVAKQWTAARENAAKCPEDAEYWQGRMLQIIAESSGKLREYFEDLAVPALQKEQTFATEYLVKARAKEDNEARIQWQNVVYWIDKVLVYAQHTLSKTAMLGETPAEGHDLDDLTVPELEREKRFVMQNMDDRIQKKTTPKPPQDPKEGGEKAQGSRAPEDNEAAS